MPDIITVMTEFADTMASAIEFAIDAGVTMEELDQAMGGDGAPALTSADCPAPECDHVFTFRSTDDVKDAIAHARAHAAEYDTAA